MRFRPPATSESAFEVVPAIRRVDSLSPDLAQAGVGAAGRLRHTNRGAGRWSVMPKDG